MGSGLAPSGRALAAMTTEYRAAGVEAVLRLPPTAPHCYDWATARIPPVGA